MSHSIDLQKFKDWFFKEKRDFPWRNNPTPYGVWVSEVMLQQTQAAVVIPYFERWMQQFPTIASLAEAPLDSVIKAWEGLGYYSRARNLHAGAKKIMQDYGGILPNEYEALAAIKGLGPYTIGAILSFAFHKQIPALDSNAVRVLARHHMIEDDISKSATMRKIHTIAESLLSDEEPWIINEALIELGATVCSKQPKCYACPLNQSCRACRYNATTKIPFKAAKKDVQSLQRIVLVLQSGEHLLVQRRQEGKIMADLHEFPFIEVDKISNSPIVATDYLFTHWGITPSLITTFPIIKQAFTRYRVQLTPLLFHCEKHTIPGSQWMHFSEISQKAFSSGHRRILKEVIPYFHNPA